MIKIIYEIIKLILTENIIIFRRNSKENHRVTILKESQNLVIIYKIKFEK